MTPSPSPAATITDISADISFAVGALLGSKHHVKPEAIDEAIKRLERVSAYLRTKFFHSAPAATEHPDIELYARSCTEELGDLDDDLSYSAAKPIVTRHMKELLKDVGSLVESDEDAVARAFADAAPKPSARYVCVKTGEPAAVESVVEKTDMEALEELAAECGGRIGYMLADGGFLLTRQLAGRIELAIAATAKRQGWHKATPDAAKQQSPDWNRDKDWVLAIASAVGIDSGLSIPIVPEPDVFCKFFEDLKIKQQSPRLIEWQPIESAPKDGTRILAYEDDEPVIVHWYNGTWESMAGNEWNPTHWMSLPSPPGA